MPENQLTQFEHRALEADIELLAKEIQKHRESPELKGAGDRELIKAALRSVGSYAAHDDDKDGNVSREEKKENTAFSFLPDYVKNFPAEERLEVEYLLDMATHKGILRANARAEKAQAAVLDAFHDALAGKLHSLLEQKGAFR